MPQGKALYRRGGKFGWDHSKTPITYRKPYEVDGKSFILDLIVQGITEPNGPYKSINYELRDSEKNLLLSMPNSDWADLRGKELLYAQNGKLFSVILDNQRPLQPATELADFNDMKFEAIEAPEWAKTWEAVRPLT